jgi:hypothetical protein
MEKLFRSVLQYSPIHWVHPTCSGISRYRSSAPKVETSRWLFLHEDLIQSCQIKSLEHLLRFNKTHSNHSPMALLLSRTLGTQSWSLWPQAGESDVREIDEVQIYVLLINYISYNLKVEDSINFIEVPLEGLSGGWLLGTAVGSGVPPPSDMSGEMEIPVSQRAMGRFR